jgi:AraC family transcriptional regulator
MNRPHTARDYARRLDRVAAHIWAHLDEDLDLGVLAEIACFSPYHFHRIYRAVLGETVAETVARLRLQRASMALARSGAPIRRIAQAAGYGSVPAFTRAFRAAYGQTPAAFRSRRRHPQDTAMTVDIRDCPPLRIACVTHKGPAPEIGEAFDRLMAWAGPRGLAGGEHLGVAVYLSDMATTPPAEQIALAGLTIEPDFQVDGAVETFDIQAGRYAVLLHRGPYATLGQSYDALFAWLTASPHSPAHAPCIEVNLNDPRRTAPEALMTEIRLPLA